MSAMRTALYATARTAIAVPLIGAVCSAANAQTNIWKECGTQYQAAKAAIRLDGQSWRQFLETCRVRVAEQTTESSTKSASAQTNILKACGGQYRAAKVLNELHGQSWVDFLKACRARGGKLPAQASDHAATPAAASATVEPMLVPAPPPAVAPAPAPAMTSSSRPAGESAESAPAPAGNLSEPPVGKPASQSLVSEKFRQKKCAAQWKAHKTELRSADPTLNWSRYWSECDKRLKVSGQ